MTSSFLLSKRGAQEKQQASFQSSHLAPFQ